MGPADAEPLRARTQAADTPWPEQTSDRSRGKKPSSRTSADSQKKPLDDSIGRVGARDRNAQRGAACSSMDAHRPECADCPPSLDQEWNYASRAIVTTGCCHYRCASQA